MPGLCFFFLGEGEDSLAATVRGRAVFPVGRGGEVKVKQLSRRGWRDVGLVENLSGHVFTIKTFVSRY